MLEIIAVGVVRESRKFSGHPCIGALRGHLCDSTAFLSDINISQDIVQRRYRGMMGYVMALLQFLESVLCSEKLTIGQYLMKMRQNLGGVFLTLGVVTTPAAREIANVLSRRIGTHLFNVTRRRRRRHRQLLKLLATGC